MINYRQGELQADLANASEDQKDNINEEIKDLNVKKNVIGDRLSKIDNVTEDQWEQLRGDADQTLDRIGNRLKDIGSKVKDEMH